MKCPLSLVAAIVLVPLVSLATAQESKSTNPKNDPSMSECIADARHAVDVEWLSRRPASEINELDWKLSVCEGRFLPLKPEGATLIAEGHGFVADEFRKRIERAIGSLPRDLQKQVWAAFNSDRGDSSGR